jgi:hypothetical protein
VVQSPEIGQSRSGVRAFLQTCDGAGALDDTSNR